MDIYEVIDYWLNELDSDLHCFDAEGNKEIVRKLFYFFADNNNLYFYQLEGEKGIIAYSLSPDFRGVPALHELFMYIKREYRGSFKLFRQLIKHVEQAAKDNNCATVRIGANLKYKDSEILSALKYFGYQTDTVIKYL